ncbi:MAG TPA: TetR/AcrR family transcriptional regulator [Clostridiaceae bacterium]|nr:TetR/AcrR family transcriptional regulator [Clostridiaceae bacterium]
MPSTKDKTEETKNKIIEVAKRHFSEKGFDAARIHVIAKDVGVNKALIYYYFKNKEAILDHLIQTLFNDLSKIIMTFTKDNIITMINEGRLNIQGGRWRFMSEEDAGKFYEAGLRYCKDMVDFVLSNRRVIRILIFESLKNGKYQKALFRFLDMLNAKDDGSLFKTNWNGSPDFGHTVDSIVFKFFFGFVPLFNLAAYFDDYVKSSGIGESELRASFMRCYEKMLLNFFS